MPCVERDQVDLVSISLSLRTLNNRGDVVALAEHEPIRAFFKGGVLWRSSIVTPKTP
jgi:hypothetical protein